MTDSIYNDPVCARCHKLHRWCSCESFLYEEEDWKPDWNVLKGIEVATCQQASSNPTISFWKKVGLFDYKSEADTIHTLYAIMPGGVGHRAVKDFDTAEECLIAAEELLWRFRHLYIENNLVHEAPAVEKLPRVVSTLESEIFNLSRMQPWSIHVDPDADGNLDPYGWYKCMAKTPEDAMWGVLQALGVKPRFVYQKLVDLGFMTKVKQVELEWGE